PDDLFIAADPHQRIYENRVSLASLGISVRGRSQRLSLNYRTTQEILAWAVPLLGDDPVTGLDGEAHSLLGYRSPMRGQRPQLRVAASRAEEFDLIAERIRLWLAAGIEAQAIGVTARSASLVREAREALRAGGIMTVPLSGRGSARAVRVGTMHATKGLEFQAVAVIGVEQGLVPEPAAVTPESEDAVAMPRTCSGNAASCSSPVPGPGIISTCPPPASRACSCRLVRPMSFRFFARIEHQNTGEPAARPVRYQS